jgi:prepilin-type N-terminal cleavage/methylation domain-containing protein/prepilin-type processing-associated H-X9-DG protein
MRTRTPERKSQRSVADSLGFTLIELLVVVAIIGVLASLLFPTVSRVKSKARRVECLSRQKQWALAFQLYASDQDNWLPREGYDNNGEVYWNNWAQVQSARSVDVWYNTLPALLSTRSASHYALQPLRRSFYQKESFFHCPSAHFSQRAHGLFALFSIAMNSQLVDPPNVPVVRTTRISNPAQTVLLLDNLLEEEERVVENQSQDYLGQPAAYANRFAGRRHGRGGNMAFADGHVEWVRGEDVVATNGVNIGWAILPPVRIFWETN